MKSNVIRWSALCVMLLLWSCSPQQPSSVCKVTSDCPAGQVCSGGNCVVKTGDCVKNTDCQSNQVCTNGQCTSQNTGGCTQNGDCKGNETCVSGKCQTTTTGCSKNADCSSGEVCLDGKCQVQNPGCTKNGDCVGTEICVNGKCQIPSAGCSPAGKKECKDIGTVRECQGDGNWKESSCVKGEKCESGECKKDCTGLTPFGDHCYQHITGPVNWNTARSYCISKGGDLVSIHNRAENDFVSVLSGGKIIWIGFNDIANEGVFEWSDKMLVKYTNWNPGDPNNEGGAEDCVTQNYGLAGGWNDSRCSDSYTFVCKWLPGTYK